MVSTQRCSEVRSEKVSSRALYYGGGLSGRAGNWVDGAVLEGTRRTYTDENHHLPR
jgi:hypothetical protein